MKSFYAGAKDASNSNHHIKMLAAYALLEDPRVEGLYFIDMDAYAPPEAMGVVPPLYAGAHGDGLVDVLFENSRDPRKFWHVHGDTFYLRDSPLARLFLREWITWRCGFKDQYSLWHAILVRPNDPRPPPPLSSPTARPPRPQRLAGRGGCLAYHDEIFEKMTYQEALHIDLEAYPNLALSCDDRRRTCPGRGPAPRPSPSPPPPTPRARAAGSASATTGTTSPTSSGTTGASPPRPRAPSPTRPAANAARSSSETCSARRTGPRRRSSRRSRSAASPQRRPWGRPRPGHKGAASTGRGAI